MLKTSSKFGDVHVLKTCKKNGVSNVIKSLVILLKESIKHALFAEMEFNKLLF